MRSRQLQLDRYDTDKVRNGYLQWYDATVGAEHEKVLRVLELGVHRGGSLALWRDYFPNATIGGVDRDLSQLVCEDRTRIEVFEGSQTDAGFLRSTAAAFAPEGLDVVIDDASHVGWESEIAFRALFEHLRRGGWYVIEDWGTGYVGSWTDGRRPKEPRESWTHRIARRFGIHPRIRSHDHGMVGFIKRLVDEQGMAAFSAGTKRTPFSSMTITPGIVAIRKR